MYHDEPFEIILSSSSGCTLEPFVLSYYCDKSEVKEIFGMEPWSIVDPPYIRYLFTCEKFCSMNGGDIRKMTRSLLAVKNAKGSTKSQRDWRLQGRCRWDEKSIKWQRNCVWAVAFIKGIILGWIEICMKLFLEDVYSVFMSEPMHNLSLSIIKIVSKIIFLAYAFFRALRAKKWGIGNSTMYYDLLLQLHYWGSILKKGLKICMLFLKRSCKKFNVTIVCIFEIHCKSGLFAMEFHHLDQLCDDLEKLGSICF